MGQMAEAAVIILSFVAVAACTVTAVFGWRTVRRVRRWRSSLARMVPPSVAGAGTEGLTTAWSHAHRASLAARAVVVPGPRREGFRLRHDLWTHVGAADGAVRAARAGGTPVGDLPHLLAQLQDRARRHDQSLVLLARGVRVVDPVEARAETARITGMADRVSAAAVEALRADAPVDPAEFQLHLEHEARAVAAGAERARSLPGPQR